jgi:hypothetical protein
MRARPNLEAIIWPREIQLPKKNLEKLAVIMLPCMNQNILNSWSALLIEPAHGPDQRSNLHVIGPRATNENDFHGMNLTMFGPKRSVTDNGNRCHRKTAHRNFAFDGLKSGSGPPLDSQ